MERAVFRDIEDARRRIGLYIDYYNFHRVHQGIGGLVPADRYFDAAPEVLKALRERVDPRALELARSGLPSVPFYMAGNAGGKPFSVHAEGERIFLTGAGGEKKEIELREPAAGGQSDEVSAEAAAASEETYPSALIADGSPAEMPGEPASEGREPAPGTSPLDELGFDDLAGDDLPRSEGGDR